MILEHAHMVCLRSSSSPEMDLFLSHKTASFDGSVRDARQTEQVFSHLVEQFNEHM